MENRGRKRVHDDEYWKEYRRSYNRKKKEENRLQLESSKQEIS